MIISLVLHVSMPGNQPQRELLQKQLSSAVISMAYLDMKCMGSAYIFLETALSKRFSEMFKLITCL